MTARPYRSTGLMVYTPPCLIRWPHLFTPRVNKMNPTKAPQYEATAVLDGAERVSVNGQEMGWIDAFKGDVDRYCIREFGQPVRAMLEMLGPDTFILPIKPNSLPKRAKHVGIKERPNGINLSAGTQYPLDSQNVTDRHGRTLIGGREGEIYDGIMGILCVGFYKWSHSSGKRGISLNLIGIQKVGDGPRLGGAQMETEEEQEINAPGWSPEMNMAPPAEPGYGAPTAGHPGGYPQPAPAAPQYAPQAQYPAQPGGAAGVPQQPAQPGGAVPGSGFGF